MEFIKLIGAVMVFFVFIAGGLFFISANITAGNIDNTADVANQTDILTTIEDKLNTTYSTADDQYDTLVEGEVSTTDAIGFLIKGGYESLVKIVQMFGVMNDVFEQIAGHLHIPSFIIDAFVVLILAGITITIIYMMFRFQPK